MEIKPLKSHSCYQLLTEAATGCSIRKGVLRNFAKFTGKHLCQSQIVSGIGVFLIIVLKFLRSFLQNTSKRLLL